MVQQSVALITGQDGSYLAEFLLAKGKGVEVVAGMLIMFWVKWAGRVRGDKLRQGDKETRRQGV